MRVMLFLLFVLLTSFCYSQTKSKSLSSKEFQLHKQRRIEEVKNSLSCNYFDTAAFQILDTNICDVIDTTLFRYIPVIKNNYTVYNDSIRTTLIILEILLYHIKNKRIIGSAHFGKEGKATLYFKEEFTSRMPMRSHNRLCCYMPSEDYNKASYFIKKQEGFFMYIERVDYFFFCTQGEKPKALCKMKRL